MTIQEERSALLRSGMLPVEKDIEQLLWGVISGEKLQNRPGILFIVDEYWGFYGRDFEFLTSYAGFYGKISMLEAIEGPFERGPVEMPFYQLSGFIEEEGLQRYVFVPDEMVYRQKMEVVERFFSTLHERVNQLVHPEAQASFTKGKAALERGDLEEAESFFWQAYRIDTRSSLPPYYLALTIMQRDPDEAIELFKEAQRRQFDDDEQLRLSLARAFIEAEKYDEIESTLKPLIRKGHHSEAYLLLAEAEAQRGEKINALRYLRQAVASAPSDRDLHALLAYRAADFGERHLAEQSLKRAEGSEHPAYTFAAALLAYDDGDTDLAIHFLNETLRRDPSLTKAAALLDELDPQRQKSAQSTNVRQPIPAPLTEEELQQRSSEFLEKDLLIALHQLESLKEAFLNSWLEKLTQIPTDPHALLSFTEELHMDFITTLRRQTEQLKPTLISCIRNDKEDFALSLPHEERPFFNVKMLALYREIDPLLEQAVVYAQGVIDGRLFENLIQNLQKFESFPLDEVTNTLERPIERALQLLQGQLERWGKSYYEKLASWILPFSPEAQAAAKEITRPPQQDVPAGTSLRNFAQLEENEEKRELSPLLLKAPDEEFLDEDTPPTGTDIHQFDALTSSDPFASEQPNDPFAFQPSSDPFASEQPNDPFAFQPSSDPFASEQPNDPFAFQPSSDPFKEEKDSQPPSFEEETRLSNSSLILASRSKPTSKRSRRPPQKGRRRRAQQENPYGELYQQYLAAFHFIGIQPTEEDQRNFIRQIEENIRKWVAKTGEEPELYIRIEGGKPQVKVRER